MKRRLVTLLLALGLTIVGEAAVQPVEAVAATQATIGPPTLRVAVEAAPTVNAYGLECTYYKSGGFGAAKCWAPHGGFPSTFQLKANFKYWSNGAWHYGVAYGWSATLGNSSRACVVFTRSNCDESRYRYTHCPVSSCIITSLLGFR